MLALLIALYFSAVIDAFDSFYAYDNNNYEESILNLNFEEIEANNANLFYDNRLWDSADSLTVYKPVQYSMKCNNNYDICLCENSDTSVVHQCSRAGNSNNARAIGSFNNYYYDNDYDEDAMMSGLKDLIAASPVVTHPSTLVSSVLAKLGALHWSQPNTGQEGYAHFTLQQDALCLLAWAAGKPGSAYNNEVKPAIDGFVAATSRDEATRAITGIMSDYPRNLNFYYSATNPDHKYSLSEVYNYYLTQIKHGSTSAYDAVVAKDKQVTDTVEGYGADTKKLIGAGQDVKIKDFMNKDNAKYYGNWILKQSNDAKNCNYR